MDLKVTVCGLSDNEKEFVMDWNALCAHTQVHKPDLVLLPELPFGKWIADSNEVDQQARQNSMNKHNFWLNRLNELGAKYVVYSKPVQADSKFYNTAFLYEKDKGHTKLHTKYYFPEEPQFYEQTWYDRPEKKFEVFQINGIKIGVLLCTEMWFTEHAREYGKQGADLLLCPRATGLESVEQWVRCGQNLAVISGAYCLSSNKTGITTDGFKWGGNGWVAAPGNGQLICNTEQKRFATVLLDLSRSAEAKLDYPLYVKE